MTDTGEVRITSKTGGQKGSKPLRYDLIPTGALAELAEHYGKGAGKYEQVNGRDNWRNGYEWSLSYAACQRHLQAFWAGENLDPETGSAHLTAVAWHAFTLLEFMREYPDLDDRQDPLYDTPELEPRPAILTEDERPYRESGSISAKWAVRRDHR